MISENDHRKRYCPRLGHELSFAYCREPGEKKPCNNIFDCWWETFEVEPFMRRNYSEQIVAEILIPKKEKILSIFEIIQKAQKSTKK